MANLIVYYSRTGENYWAGGVKNINKGNTERVAEFIQQAVGGDLFEIEPIREYSGDYYVCIDEAKAEQNADERPEVREIPDTTDYDTIFIGYPNWWGTMPMFMFTVVEGMDLAGKRVIPFCTNEGSGLGSSESDLERIATGAIVESGLSVTGNQAANSQAKVSAWAKQFA